MKSLNLFNKLGLALACAALVMTAVNAEARDIKAYAGTTFTLTPIEFDPQGNPIKFNHTVDGVVRVSLLGNCTFHADVLAIPGPGGTFGATGTFRITTADGLTTLDAEAEAIVTPDPANPAFGNFHYDVKFTGGTGRMANARGRADIDGVAMFTTPDFSAGKATWVLNGQVVTRGKGQKD